jgi:hypothetical protein
MVSSSAPLCRELNLMVTLPSVKAGLSPASLLKIVV